MDSTFGMGTQRTIINLRGFCLYCLGKTDRSFGALSSPTSTPSTPNNFSSPCTPLKNRFVHSLPLEERLAPFVDLCRYLGIDVPDKYAFGDGIESETLTPPLCHKCHELSSRLCALQEELQYIQTRINNTVRRIYQRIQTTCGDQRRGALKREVFQKEFRNKSKGLLSRGRKGENSNTPAAADFQKTLDLLRSFQMKILEKGGFECEKRNITQKDLTALFAEYQFHSPSAQPSQTPQTTTISSDVLNEGDEENEESKKERKELEDVDVKTESHSSHANSEDVEIKLPVDDEKPMNDDVDISIMPDNFLPSETLHWAGNATVIEEVRTKDKVHSIDAYRQELEALRTEPKGGRTGTTGFNSCPGSAGSSHHHTPFDKTVNTLSLSAAVSKACAQKTLFKGEVDSSKISNSHPSKGLVIDSSRVTSRRHRLRIRRRILVTKDDLSGNVENDDDEEIITLS